MQNMHFLSLPPLPIPYIFKSLTAFLVLNINHVLSREFRMSRWSPPSIRGCVCPRYLLLPGRAGSLHSTMVAQSIHRLKGQWVCVFLSVQHCPFSSGNGTPLFLWEVELIPLVSLRVVPDADLASQNTGSLQPQ